jgi:hypothetical protein
MSAFAEACASVKSRCRRDLLRSKRDLLRCKRALLRSKRALLKKQKSRKGLKLLSITLAITWHAYLRYDDDSRALLAMC